MTSAMLAESGLVTSTRDAEIAELGTMPWREWRFRAIRAIMNCVVDEFQKHKVRSDMFHLALRTFHRFTTAYETLDSFIAEIFVSGEPGENVCAHVPFLYHFKCVLEQCAGDLDFILSTCHVWQHQVIPAIWAFYTKLDPEFFDKKEWSNFNVELKGAILPEEFMSLLRGKAGAAFFMNKAVDQLEVVHTSLSGFLT